MTNTSQFKQPESMRLERAAGILDMHVDDLLQLAQRGKPRVCIKGGGREFSSFENAPGELPEQRVVKPRGVVSVHSDMYLDVDELSEILATGRARLGSVLIDCDNPERFFIPREGWGRLVIELQDLWIRASDMPAPRTAAPAVKESVEDRQKRRLTLWTREFDGSVHLVRSKWTHTAPAGQWTAFVQRLAGEPASSAKTLRADLQAAAKAQAQRGNSVFNR